jgi:hypothetical protein
VSIRLVLLMAALVSIGVESHNTASAAEPLCHVTNCWQVVESANFRIYGMSTTHQLASLSQTCEQIRDSLSDHWLGQVALQPWQPKCLVVLHPNEASYAAAVNSAQSSGSSSVDFAAGQVAVRRIDLRGDRREFMYDALPHELTHVVLVDAFPHSTVPLWADEGLAMLGEHEAQQQLHLTALRAEACNRPAYRLPELFALCGYPSNDKQAQFYDQSTSVVRWLVNRRKPSEFVQFLRTAQSAGYDQALRTHYGIDGVAQLEHLLPVSGR